MQDRMKEKPGKEECKGELKAMKELISEITDRATYEELRILWIMAKNIIK